MYSFYQIELYEHNVIVSKRFFNLLINLFILHFSEILSICENKE